MSRPVTTKSTAFTSKQHYGAGTDAEPSSPLKPDTPPSCPCHLSHERFMRLPEVLRLTALGRSTLYTKIAAGKFPGQRQLGENIVAWYASEVQAWIQNPT